MSEDETIARAIADALGYQWDTLYASKTEWTQDRGSRHDINVPYKPDFIEAAKAVQRLWRPIETAPKDGCGNGIFGIGTRGPYILLCNADCGPVIGFWNGRAWDDGDYDSHMGPFTHWMPLPEPPAILNQGETG